MFEALQQIWFVPFLGIAMLVSIAGCIDGIALAIGIEK